MPKPRLPTNVLALRGTIAHDPARYADRASEPQPSEFVDPATLPVPATLSELEALAWVDLAGKVHGGSVAVHDLPALVTMARLYAVILFGESIDLRAVTAFRQYLALFGMTPADRSRVSVIDPRSGTVEDADDEFARQ